MKNNGHTNNGPPKMSFTETHRRRQIIETAVRTIAAQGIAQASLGNIAKAAGISKGVISYYFNSKAELIDQVMTTLLDEMSLYIRERVDREHGVLNKLCSYVDASLDFVTANRDKFVVTTELMMNPGPENETGPFGAETYQRCRTHIERILGEGRESGELSVPDTVTTAAVIQGIIDGVSLQWISDPDSVDMGKCRLTVLNLVRLYMKDAAEPSSE